MSMVPVKCDCGAYFIFAETPAGEPTPIDPAPSPNGTMTLTRRDGDQLPLARNVKVAARFGRTDLYISHFATCPNADQHRRKKPKPTGQWLAANAPIDEPYPCRCHREGVGCRAGGAHCPCRGRTDLDHLPASCCAKRAASTKEP